MFPGCSMEGTAGAFDSSLDFVFGKLGLACETLRDWNCCGASSAHAVDHELYLALNLRNLMSAQEQGYNQVLAPCAACYHRLSLAQLELSKDAELLARLNRKSGLRYEGRIAVRNVLDFLTQNAPPAAVAAKTINRLTGMKAVCYYGCLNTRIPRSEPFDDREYPMTMDRLVEATGARALNWSYKTECCGASLFVTNEEVCARLVSRILRDATARGADLIVVACPMCHNNLDTKQEEIRAAHNLPKPIPVLFITQLLGLAFGGTEAELGIEKSFVPFGAAAK